MGTLRIKNKYLYLSLILFFGLVFLLYILGNPNIIRVVLFGWYLEPEYTSAQEYFRSIYTYNSFIYEGLKPVQFFLPILAIIPIIHYKEEVEHFFEHLFVRGKKYRKEIITSLLSNALLIAGSFYVVYILIIIIGYLVFPLDTSGVIVSAKVFADVLGSEIGNNYMLYNIFVGFVRVLLPTFFYSLFAMSLLIYSSKKNTFLFIPVIYHFVMMFAIPIISSLTNNINMQNILIYFAPQMLLAPGGFSNPSTIMLLVGFSPYLLICISLIFIRLMGKERIGTNE